MNDDQITDLKQFLATTVRQEVTTVVRQEIAGLATKEDLTDLRQAMDTKFDEVQQSISQAMDTTNDDVDERLRGLEARVGRLEHKAA